MKYRDCMIAWTPDDAARRKYDTTAGAVEVGPHPDTTGWSRQYECTTGGCYTEMKATSQAQKATIEWSALSGR